MRSSTNSARSARAAAPTARCVLRRGARAQQQQQQQREPSLACPQSHELTEALLYSPETSIYVSSEALLYTCPHTTTMCVSSDEERARSSANVASSRLPSIASPHKGLGTAREHLAGEQLILRCTLALCLLLYVCPHTTIYVCQSAFGRWTADSEVRASMCVCVCVCVCVCDACVCVCVCVYTFIHT